MLLQIKIWFQNRRARERREKCANITPPLTVTLPPTTTTHVSWLNSSVSWTTTRNDMPTHPLNLNVMKSEEPLLERTVVYSRDMVPNERSSFSESTDDDSADLQLDIETIED